MGPSARFSTTQPQRGHRADGSHGIAAPLRPRERSPHGSGPDPAGGGTRVPCPVGGGRGGRAAPDRARPPRRCAAAAHRSHPDAAAGAGAGARQRLPTRRSSQILDEASEELLAAVDELRELARGIHPAILTEDGAATGCRGPGTAVARCPSTSHRDSPNGCRPGGRGGCVLHRRRGARQRDAALGRTPAVVSIARVDGHLDVEMQRRRVRRGRRSAGHGSRGHRRPAGRGVGRLAASTARGATEPGCGRRSRARDRGGRLRGHPRRRRPHPGRRRAGRGRARRATPTSCWRWWPSTCLTWPSSTSGCHPTAPQGCRAAAGHPRRATQGWCASWCCPSTWSRSTRSRLLGPGVGGVGYLLKDRVAEGQPAPRGGHRVARGRVGDRPCRRG